jgi:dTDP-4-dehydrorhamnose 3,5-epimerase
MAIFSYPCDNLYRRESEGVSKRYTDRPSVLLGFVFAQTTNCSAPGDTGTHTVTILNRNNKFGMELIKTTIENCFLIRPKVFHDSRGLFFEAFNSIEFERLTGVSTSFVQDNVSSSSYGVIRGLHFQKGDASQAKLVSVLAGKVLDVAVDLRQGSSTYGQHVAYILDDVERMQLFVPKGFAHGFSVLSDSAIFSYKCDNYYNREQESGIRFDDPALSIDWKIPQGKLRISEKDLQLPFLH